MKEYERLTISEIRLNDDRRAKEFFICGVTIYDLYNRLAELEDKIENGTLMEINKPFIKTTKYGSYICKATVIVVEDFDTKAEAEAKLKELKGEV